MNLQASSHWSVGELRFATLPSVPPSLLQEISEAFQLRLPPGSTESSHAYPVLLRSADDSWAVRLEPSALAIETRADEPYDFLVQHLPEIARIALPYLDTDFFTRTAVWTIRSLPLSEAMAGTQAIAEQAYRYQMAMTSTKAGNSPAGHVIIQETVGPSRGLCTRDVAIYEEAVESFRLESILKGQVVELSEIEIKPDRRELTLWDRRPIAGSGLGLFLTRLLPSFDGVEVQTVQERDAQSETDNLNEDRIRLLARKYADASFSREDEARLEILQKRILHLLPSVEQHDFERLEELAAITRRVHERHLERMNRLGLAK